MTNQTMETVTQQQETVTKQKNPLRIEQGRKLVEYNRHKKEELKRLNEQIINKMEKTTNLGPIQILFLFPNVKLDWNNRYCIIFDIWHPR